MKLYGAGYGQSFDYSRVRWTRTYVEMWGLLIPAAFLLGWALFDPPVLD